MSPPSPTKPTGVDEDPGVTAGTDSSSDRLRVLSLSANPTASFYQQQISSLEEHDIDCTTISPPPYEGNDRSPWQYLRIWINTLRETSSDYDLVHANYGLVGPIALAQPKRPVVMTLWGTDVMSDGWVPSVSKAAASRCDAVVAPSTRLAESLPCESHVIQFDVDMDLFRPIPQAAARRRLGWDDDATIVFFPYGNRAVKNQPLARRVVEQLSIEAELKRVWGVPHEMMPLYYNASDALLVTSDREAGPMTVKEAAACNVPVVSTDVGFVSELLSEIEHSHVAESESALVEQLGNVLRRGERPSGRSVVRRYNDMGAQLHSVYRSVI